MFDDDDDDELGCGSIAFLALIVAVLVVVALLKR